MGRAMAIPGRPPAGRGGGKVSRHVSGARERFLRPRRPGREVPHVSRPGEKVGRGSVGAGLNNPGGGFSEMARATDHWPRCCRSCPWSSGSGRPGKEVPCR